MAAAMIVASASGLSAQSAQGGSAEPAIVAYRQALMNTNAQHLASLRTLLAAEDLNLPDHIRKHALALAENGKLLRSQTVAGTSDVFPEGSAHPASRALDVIWTDRDAFLERARAFAYAAEKLNEAAQRGAKDEVRAALTEVQQSCAACHGEFRRPAAQTGS